MGMAHLAWRESVLSSEPRVDRKASVIRDVHVLGFTSKNRRKYLPEAVRKALHLYEGRVVNLDHHIRDNSTPDVPIVKRFGRLRNARFDESRGVVADLFYNPKHQHAEQILWDVENDPNKIGLSHDASGSGDLQPNGEYLVRNIERVDSVDLVADAATTNGILCESTRLLKESDMEPPITPPPGGGEGPDSAEHLGSAIKAIACDKSMDIKTKRKKILALVKLLDDSDPDKDLDEAPDADLPDSPEGEKKAMESLRLGTHPAVRWAVRRLDAIQVREAFVARKKLMGVKCREAKLPEVSITETFIESLAYSRDDMVSKLIEDRRLAVQTNRAAISNPPDPSVATPPAKPVKDIVAEMWK